VANVEIPEAIRLGRTIVLVHETSDAHGGYTDFNDYLEECQLAAPGLKGDVFRQTSIPYYHIPGQKK
jgi:hypothetical protein